MGEMEKAFYAVLRILVGIAAGAIMGYIWAQTYYKGTPVTLNEWGVVIGVGIVTAALGYFLIQKIGKHGD